MKYRHMFLLVLLAVALVFIGSAFYLNQALLARDFRLPFQMTMSVEHLLIMVFVAGILVSFLLYRSIRLDNNLTWSSNRLFVRALNHLYADRFEEAFNEIETAYRKSGNNYDILMTRGVICKRLERIPESLASFQKAFSRKPTIQAYLKIIDLLDDHGAEMEPAVLSKLLQKLGRESRPAAYRALLDHLKRSGEWTLAFKVYRKARKEDTGRFPETEGAELRYELGKLRGSRRIMKDLIGDFPAFAPAYDAYAELLKETGDTEEMLKVLKEGFSRTRIVIFLQKIEDHLLTNENPERAVEELGQIMLNENHHVLARFYLGKLYYRLEMLDKAREIFENLEGEVEYIPALPHFLAHIYFRKGNVQTAFRYMEELVERTHVLSFRFHCDNCHELLDEWTERCPKCSTINSVRMIYEELKSDTAPIFML